MEEEIQERLGRKDVFKFDCKEHLKYFDVTGTPKAKAAFKMFLEKNFSKGENISEDNVNL